MDNSHVLYNIYMTPRIIYEDDNVIVLDKPSGMLSMRKHPEKSADEPSVEDYGILVHRLDRATSGIIIVAKNEEVRANLARQFQNRTVKKTYYALVSPPPKLPHAIIDVPLTRDLKRHTAFRPDPAGRSAQTEYWVESTKGNVALVKLQPKTGRTHQLRVHLAHLGSPILGDTVYHGADAPRLMLHATELELTLPGGERKTFTSPLPPEFSL